MRQRVWLSVRTFLRELLLRTLAIVIGLLITYWLLNLIVDWMMRH